MEKSGSKIHKLGTPADRTVDTEVEAGHEPVARPAEETIRYVAVPHYDAAFLAGDDAIDLLELWSILNRYKKALLSVVLLALLVSIGVATLTPPLYRAELIAAPVTEEKGGGLSALAGQFGGLASLAGVNIASGGSDVNRLLATLHSRAFLVGFLKQEAVFKALSAQLAKDDLTLLDAYDYFVENVVDVRKDNKTGLVTLSIEWREPQLAADWANDLLLQLNEHQRKNAIHEAEQSIEYLNTQLQQTGVVDMQQAIYRLIEAQTKSIMLANVKKEYALQVIDPAVASEEPVYPRVGLIISLGTMLGLILGVFLVFVLHAVHNFRSRLQPDAEYRT
ncbi:MAG: GNVR domain-containing protein [Gammaproteobacteria bacterium]|nr:GNVR domain-containing protein [Gammaproteobacteria bacterium]